MIDKVSVVEVKRWDLVFSQQMKNKAPQYFAEIVNFLNSPTQKEYIVNDVGVVMLGGLVYGHPNFDDGDDIHTSGIAKFIRKDGCYDFPDDDKLIAVTQSGSEYHFVQTGNDGMSPEAFMRIGDFLHAQKLRLLFIS